jgi:hypothetical protein
VQSVNAAPSSEHSNVASCSSAENVNRALSLSVVVAGPESIAVSGAVVSGDPNVITSCGGLSPFSLLWNCCSASAPSLASRIRKPW